jgi:hypothetical protein
MDDGGSCGCGFPLKPHGIAELRREAERSGGRSGAQRNGTLPVIGPGDRAETAAGTALVTRATAWRPAAHCASKEQDRRCSFAWNSLAPRAPPLPTNAGATPAQIAPGRACAGLRGRWARELLAQPALSAVRLGGRSHDHLTSSRFRRQAALAGGAAGLKAPRLPWTRPASGAPFWPIRRGLFSIGQLTAGPSAAGSLTAGPSDQLRSGLAEGSRLSLRSGSVRGTSGSRQRDHFRRASIAAGVAATALVTLGRP